MTMKLAILALGLPTPGFFYIKQKNLLSCLNHILQFPTKTNPNLYTHLNRSFYLLRKMLKEIKWHSLYGGRADSTMAAYQLV